MDLTHPERELEGANRMGSGVHAEVSAPLDEHGMELEMGGNVAYNGSVAEVSAREREI